MLQTAEKFVRWPFICFGLRLFCCLLALLSTFKFLEALDSEKFPIMALRINLVAFKDLEKQKRLELIETAGKKFKRQFICLGWDFKAPKCP